LSATPPEPTAPGRRKLPSFLSAFQFRSYRVLWTGAFLSSVGTWTQDVALGWLIHERFGNPAYLGYWSLAGQAPLLAFMVLGGAAADRIDRRRILLVSQVLQMAFAASLGILYAAGRLGLAPILVVAVLTGLAQSQSAPTYQAVLTTLVPPAQIPNAVALNSLQFNLSRAIGPAIAGLLLVRGGAGVCFAVNALSFLAVIVAIWRIEIPSPSTARQTLAESLKTGLVHVYRDPVLRTLTGVGLLGSLLAYPLLTFLPVIADQVLGTGAEGYSALMSSFGVGAIAGAVTTAHRGNLPGRGSRLLAALAAYGACCVGAALNPWAELSVALLLLAGFCLVSAFSVVNSLVQERAPDDRRGRIVSIYGLAFRGGMPLGSFLAGFLVKAFGVSVVIASLGGLLMLFAFVIHHTGGPVRSL
jgi:MFS family permease